MGEENADTKQGRLPPSLIDESKPSNHISLIEVLHLGVKLEYLRRSGGVTHSPERDRVIVVLEEIATILSNSDSGEVVVDMATEWIDELENSDNSSRLTEEEMDRIETQVTSWIHLLARELDEERRIPASEAGVLDTDKLAESPEDLFNPAVWEWLDERPKSDIEEACKTIAVDCPTASVMLSLRAVEHNLRKWYEQENESLDAAWGHVLDQLMEEYAEEEKKNDTVLTQLSDLPPILSTLYYLKEKRNEVNHPDESPSNREARRTLMIVASTITEIYNEMKIGQFSSEPDIRQAEVSETLEHTLSTRNQLNETEEAVLNLMEGLAKANKEQNEEGTRGTVHQEEIISAGEEMDINRADMQEILDSLMMSGRIYEPSKNSYRII